MPVRNESLERRHTDNLNGVTVTPGGVQIGVPGSGIIFAAIAGGLHSSSDVHQMKLD